MKWLKRMVLIVLGVGAVAPGLVAARGEPASSQPTSQANSQGAGVDARATAERDPHGPMHRIAFPPGTSVGGMAFSPDGEKLYVRVSGRSINVWEVLVYYWPEVLGGVFALAAILLTFVLFRIHGKPRLVGLPHCRGCNYCLKDCASARCPECGRSARRPVVGRRMWVRTLPCTVPLGLIVICYGGLWAVRASRTNFVSNYFNWWSDGLADWAEADPKRAWLKARVQKVERIDEYNSLAGNRHRTVLTRVSGKGGPLVATPNGEWLISSHADRLSLIDSRTGHIFDELHARQCSPNSNYRWRQIVGFSDDGNIVYAVEINETELKSYLVEWNLFERRSKTLFEAPAEMGSGFTASQIDKWREYQLIPRSSPLTFIEYSNSLARPFSGEIRKRLAVPAANPSWTIEKPKDHILPAVSPDGKIIYCSIEGYKFCTTGCDLDSGEPIERIWSPSTNPQRFSCNHSSRTLLIETIENSLRPSPNTPMQPDERRHYYVWNLDLHRWVSRVVGTKGTWWAQGEPVMSPNGRYMATNVPQFAANGRIATHQEVELYNLTASLKDYSDFPEPSLSREQPEMGWIQIAPYYHVRKDHPLARLATSRPAEADVPSDETLRRHAE